MELFIFFIHYYVHAPPFAQNTMKQMAWTRYLLQWIFLISFNLAYNNLIEKVDVQKDVRYNKSIEILKNWRW